MKYTFLRFPDGKKKAFTMSYDDGSEYDIKFLKIINKYNLKCTFNIVGDFLNNGIGLTKSFIRDNIILKGHEIANHGYDHKAVDLVRPIEGIQDALNSRLCLEKEFGIIIRGIL